MFSESLTGGTRNSQNVLGGLGWSNLPNHGYGRFFIPVWMCVGGFLFHVEQGGMFYTW